MFHGLRSTVPSESLRILSDQYSSLGGIRLGLEHPPSYKSLCGFYFNKEIFVAKSIFLLEKMSRG